MYKSSIFFVIILTLLSCTKEIEIDLPKPQTKISVFSTITPFTSPIPKYLNISLLKSNYIFDSTHYYINDATVYYSMNNIIIDTLDYDIQNKTYTISSSIQSYPIAGNKYGITIVKSGFDTISATTIVPQKVEITDTSITPIVYFDETGSVSSEIRISFNDNANIKNYYEIVVSDISYNYNNINELYRLSTNDKSVVVQSYYPSLDRFDLRMPRFLLFTDDFFNGTSHTMSIYYTPPQTESDHRYISSHYISVHLRNVTKDYFMYKTTMLQHLYQREENILYGMGEPINVHSNIKNGYGIFAAYNTDIVSMHIDKTKLN